MQTRTPNRYTWPSTRSRWAVGVALGSLIAGILGCVQANAASAPTKSPAKGASKNANALRVIHPPPKATNAVTEELLVDVKSVFVDDVKVGKDPFFPKSTHRQPPDPTDTKGPVEAEGLFTLQGLSSINGRKMAIINGRTFAEGEEQDVRVKGGQSWRVKCVSIGDRAVDIEARDASSTQAPAKVRLEPRTDLLFSSSPPKVDTATR